MNEGESKEESDDEEDGGRERVWGEEKMVRVGRR
jgi:hypothetical protein